MHHNEASHELRALDQPMVSRNAVQLNFSRSHSRVKEAWKHCVLLQQTLFHHPPAALLWWRSPQFPVFVAAKPHDEQPWKQKESVWSHHIPTGWTDWDRRSSNTDEQDISFVYLNESKPHWRGEFPRQAIAVCEICKNTQTEICSPSAEDNETLSCLIESVDKSIVYHCWSSAKAREASEVEDFRGNAQMEEGAKWNKKVAARGIVLVFQRHKIEALNGGVTGKCDGGWAWWHLHE